MAFANHVDARAQNKKNGQISGYNVTAVIVGFICKYWVLSTCTCNTLPVLVIAYNVYNCFDSLNVLNWDIHVFKQFAYRSN